jgi:hypothetical protein
MRWLQRAKPSGSGRRTGDDSSLARNLRLAVLAIKMMRSALRHEYPLRGGIGYGTFHHEMSGVRTASEGQVWSTSSFLGGATVAAYQAERSPTPGLRIFIHPSVPETELFEVLTVRASKEEANPGSFGELRLWRSEEVKAAIVQLSAFRSKQPGHRSAGGIPFGRHRALSANSLPGYRVRCRLF